jgi:hypothetical protein
MEKKQTNFSSQKKRCCAKYDFIGAKLQISILKIETAPPSF